MRNYKRRTGVYCITNIINNKKYIGSSFNIIHRFNDHKSALRTNINKNPLMQKDWDEYGESKFAFSILEELSPTLTVDDYRKHEADWILKLNTHIDGFGYNIGIPDKRGINDEQRNCRRDDIKRKHINRRVIICISNTEIIEMESIEDAAKYTSAPLNKMWDYCNYWSGRNKRYKSYKGWMFVYKDEYDEQFDYFNFRHPRVNKKGTKIRHIKKYEKKAPEDIIPREQRDLKRCPVIAVNIETGEERIFPMIKSCYSEFNSMKVYKCINNPFKKYKHRGHWFKRVATQGDVLI